MSGHVFDHPAPNRRLRNRAVAAIGGPLSAAIGPGRACAETSAGTAGYLAADGVAAMAKHFPGHRDTDVESHFGFLVVKKIREEWETFDAPPFTAATYSYAADALVAMTPPKAVCGEISPAGKLPVIIPVAVQPNTPLYPYGHGWGY